MNVHLSGLLPPLRAGVVGAGVFGRHHAGKYARMPGVTLAAIADPDAQARAQAAAGLHVPTVEDWRSLLGKLDIVSICSPAVTHAELVNAFLAAGTHVLVEKPMATDLAAAEELIALAARNDLVLTVGHQERFVFARSGLLAGGHAPIEVECVREGPWTGRGTDVSVVLDLMIHDLDLMHSLIPAEVSGLEASGRRVHSTRLDSVAARVSFDNGSSAVLRAGRAAEARKRSMRMAYSDGVIEIDFLTRTVRNTTPRALPDLDMDDPLGESIASFVAAAAARTSAFVRPEEAYRALDTALKIEAVASTAAPARAKGKVALVA